MKVEERQKHTANRQNQQQILRPFFFPNCTDTKLSKDQLKSAEKAIRSLCQDFDKINSESKCMNVARWPDGPPGQADNNMKRDIVLRRMKAGGVQSKTTIVYAKIGTSLNILSITAGHDGKYLDSLDLNLRVSQTLKKRHKIPDRWLEPNAKSTYKELSSRISSNLIDANRVTKLFKSQTSESEEKFQQSLSKILSKKEYALLKNDEVKQEELLDCINQQYGRREYVEDIGQINLKKYDLLDEIIEDLQQYFPKVRNTHCMKQS